MGKNKNDRDNGRLTSNRSRWYKIQNLATGGAEVMIYDEIGFMGVTAQSFINELAGVKGPLSLRLNTPGGEVFDGLAIYNALRSRGNVSITIDGLAASIGSVIAMAADPGKLSIARRASMMIHDGFSQAIGNAKEMRDLADLLDQQSDNIAGVYADRTGKPASYWREQMKKETWYTGQDAVDAGLVDQVVDVVPTLTDSWVTDKKAKKLSAFSQRVLVTAKATQVQPASTPAPAAHDHATRTCAHCEAVGAATAPFCFNCGTRMFMAMDDNGWVQDPDGTWRFDPDGDGDNDATPEGDTDHDYFDEDGKQIKEIPPCPGAVSDVLRTTLLNFDVDNTAWDAGKAWSAGAKADDPAAFYKAICAGRKAGDPKLQSSWALPYKYSPSSAPNAAAVRAGLAALGGARGGVKGLTNREEAQSLLEGLMKKINPDYKPASADYVDPRLLQSLFTQALEGGVK